MEEGGSNVPSGSAKFKRSSSLRNASVNTDVLVKDSSAADDATLAAPPAASAPAVPPPKMRNLSLKNVRSAVVSNAQSPSPSPFVSALGELPRPAQNAPAVSSRREKDRLDRADSHSKKDRDKDSGEKKTKKGKLSVGVSVKGGHRKSSKIQATLSSSTPNASSMLAPGPEAVESERSASDLARDVALAHAVTRAETAAAVGAAARMLVAPEAAAVIVGALDNTLLDEVAALAEQLTELYRAGIGGVRVILRAATRIEVLRTPATLKETLFRSSDMASYLVVNYGLTNGQTYLRSVLAPFLQDIAEKEVAVEVDPMRTLSPSGVESQQHLLTGLAGRLLDAIFSSVGDIPVQLLDMYATVREEVHAVYPNMARPVIAGLFFLRFLCPALITPEKYKLVTSPVTGKARRTLMLVSKVLQQLGSGQQFESKESYMEFLNPLLADRQVHMNTFLDRLSTRPAGSIEPSADEVAQQLLRYVREDPPHTAHLVADVVLAVLLRWEPLQAKSAALLLDAGAQSALFGALSRLHAMLGMCSLQPVHAQLTDRGGDDGRALHTALRTRPLVRTPKMFYMAMVRDEYLKMQVALRELEELKARYTDQADSRLTLQLRVITRGSHTPAAPEVDKASHTLDKLASSLSSLRSRVDAFNQLLQQSKDFA